METNQLVLGVGTRLCHTSYGQGVIVAVKYAVYVVAFIDLGIQEIDKTDEKIQDIHPENITAELVTASDVETSLIKILQHWNGISEIVPLSDKWAGGKMVLHAKNDAIKPKEIPMETFFHKVVMLRDRLRVLEQQINAHKILTDNDKVNLQQYITRIYGTLTTFNILFKNSNQQFVGDKADKD